MPMTSGSRRVLLYWALLLLPTLAVGGGMIWLLGREQARLNEQSRAAAETRKSAVEARARLIAENVEVLVGDVEAGLMSTLREVPEGAKRGSFLKEWQRKNPLVKETFDFTATGDRPELLSLLIAQESTQHASVGQVEITAGMLPQLSTSNSAQVANVRYNLQEISKLKGGTVSAAEHTGWFPWREEGGKLRLIGWRRPAFGGMIAVEVQLALVAASLGDILPADREPGEIYELREVGGRVYQQKMLTAREQVASGDRPLITVPVSEAVLPGWEVVGYLAATEERSAAGGILFLVSALLAGVFVAAILAGGVLLMRQARRSEEEAAYKTSFVANVSHEFKTPLTTIRLYAELLEQGRVPDAGKRVDYLRTIGRETQRLARLVNNVLDFSRLEQGRKKFERIDVDLTDELGRLLDTHAPRVHEAGLELTRCFPQMPLRVKTDPDALGQILINLLDNACKYAATGREVTVVAAPGANGGAEVRVADRGPGVPAGQSERIFEKFHRIDEALTAEKGGAGLGLSIARQLARGLGGDLRYAGREGGGAEFILELP
jgi:two-component system, OmpR family, phosphate regulon sensor histidine kinase PhoR